MNEPYGNPFFGLTIFAETLDDIEKIRINLGNRLFQMKEKALLPDPVLTDLQDRIRELEDISVKRLRRATKDHPLYAFFQTSKGVGEKQVGRLLGTLGHPYLRIIFNQDQKPIGLVPRTVSQLWAYCGMDVRDGMAPSHQKGIQSNWNEDARMRVRLIAESCVKVRCGNCTQAERKRRDEPDYPGKWASPPTNCECLDKGYKYRVIYDQARMKYSKAMHLQDCKRCGSKGHPALIGSELNDSHKHARALRKVSKVFLQDLWIAAKEHEEATPETYTQDLSANSCA